MKKRHSNSYSPKKEIKYDLHSKKNNLTLNITKEKNLNYKIRKANEKNKNKIKKRNNEIELINNEIRDLKINDHKLKRNISQNLINRNIFDEKRKEIANYCNNLINKHSKIKDTVNNYEICLKEFKDEYNKLSNYYVNKIEEIEKENMKIKNECNEKIQLFEKQKNKIVDEKIKILIIKKKIEEQNKINKDRENFYNERYQKLQNKYTDLQMKIYDLFTKIRQPNKNIRIKKKNEFEAFKKSNQINILNYESGNLNKRRNKINKRSASIEDFSFDLKKNSKKRQRLYSTNYISEKNSLKTKSIN
jgi:chromosome segregation ATPase